MSKRKRSPTETDIRSLTSKHHKTGSHYTSAAPQTLPSDHRPHVLPEQLQASSLEGRSELVESDAISLDLLGLLDFTSTCTDTDISLKFERIASALLHDYHIAITSGEVDVEYEILELEFYLQRSTCHEDPFTHGSEEQKQSGQWYFHRVPRKPGHPPAIPTLAGGYRGGSRKGLDLTLGAPLIQTSPHFAKSSSSSSSSNDSPELLRGGVLLRTIRRTADMQVISGPSLLVDEILRQSGAPNIAALVADMWASDISAFSRSPSARPSAPSRAATMFLKPKQVQSPVNEIRPRVYRSPRIGLDLSHPDVASAPSMAHPRVVFVARPYRYFIHPHLLTANGRGQTFLGVYDVCAAEAQDDEELAVRLEQLTRLKASTVTKYLEEMRRGEQCVLEAFVGPAGKGASASPTTFLRMMAALRRLQESV
ncbi:hypothetical protein B0H21DRAFT_750925 [Amylocystis lapponica]|nr:hypothetical protein B0H21DRAFT_750925 [Amylocystis lapponica]